MNTTTLDDEGQALLQRLQGLSAECAVEGDFYREADGIAWLYRDIGGCEEPHDHLWDVYRETCQAVSDLLPPGWSVEDLGTDNDAAWFCLKPHAGGMPERQDTASSPYRPRIAAAAGIARR